MRTTLGIVALAGVCALGVGGYLSAEDPPRADESDYILNHDARSVYLRHCASCHGSFLEGGSAAGFIDGEWNFGSTAWDLARNIQHGIAAHGMPDYGGTLSRGEIRSLVDYLANAPKNLGVPSVSPTPEVMQTRDYDLNVEVVVDEGLEEPWAIAFVDDRRALVTEKPGRLRWLIDGELEGRAIEGVPRVRYGGQGGMMDVNVDPDYAENGWVYLAFSDLNEAGLGMTKVVRGRIENGRWTDEETVFRARDGDYVATMHHYGSRIVFDDDKNLYFAIGDRGIRADAQSLEKPNGKIHRVRRDGSIPEDNPFVDRDGDVYPSIFSYGHRNPQGMAIHPETNGLWLTEHGPMGGDELNLSEAGANYGWPDITYGINYNGTVITDETHRDGMRQPALYWVPSIAVCGLDVYRGGSLERWRGNLFAGGLAYEEVRRIVLDGDRVIHQEVVVKGLGRVRDVCCAPDGSIYVVLNGADRIVRLTYGKRVYRQ